jgi:hypothetical protein
MAGCFYLGKHLAVKDAFKGIVTALLDKLEADGFVYIITDKDGDKELVPVSSVVAKALRHANKKKA